MSVNAHLAVQRNAFSTAAAAAKVCDGATSASIAERCANAASYNSPDGEQIFILQPSIFGHEVRYVGTTTNGVTTYDTGSAPVSIHGFEAVSSTLINKKDSVSPDQYRLVSAAMRLSPINASESNQGWFEAIRVKSAWSRNGFSFINTPVAPATGPAPVIFPSKTTFEGGVILDSNWANDPSYVTGRLRELGKHTFYLQPTGPRTFKKWPREIQVATFNGFEEQPCGYDTNFDIIIVRIHSAPAPASSNTLYQSIHCHVVKNWETAYDAANPNCRFHSSTISAESAVKYTDKQMTRDPKASMIRSASSYAYKF